MFNQFVKTQALEGTLILLKGKRPVILIDHGFDGNVNRIESDPHVIDGFLKMCGIDRGDLWADFQPTYIPESDAWRRGTEEEWYYIFLEAQQGRQVLSRIYFA